MQLRLDAADRLVELVEEERGPLRAEAAAQRLFALRRPPVGLARGLLDEIVRADARLAWRGDIVGLAAAPGSELALEAAAFVVLDLETTGLAPGRAGICEIGAVRIERLALAARFETLVDPRAPLPAAVAALTGIGEGDLRGAPRAAAAVGRLLDFAGDAALVAHNARFDLAFLDREVERLTGRRVAAPVLDTVRLARRLLGGRIRRASLAALAAYFGTAVEPCHRALPDAEATAEVFLRLVGLAQERGAETVAELERLQATRARRAHDRRGLARGAPSRPGVYLFRDRAGGVLYVGRARDLRARLRTYFGSEYQRPAVEAALGALDRIEWRVRGSELEAGLEELRLIRELRPPANARGLRTDRYLYLRRRGEGVVAGSAPGPFGPIRSRRRAVLAARALGSAPSDGLTLATARAALGPLRARLRRLAEALRYEDAARLRDRIEALEGAIAEVAELERLRAGGWCLLAPAVEEGALRAFFVAGGRVVAARTLPEGGGAALEVEAGLAAARRAAGEVSHAPEDADELLLVGSFLRRPPPELRVVPLERGAILAAAGRSVRSGP